MDTVSRQGAYICTRCLRALVPPRWRSTRSFQSSARTKARIRPGTRTKPVRDPRSDDKPTEQFSVDEPAVTAFKKREGLNFTVKQRPIVPLDDLNYYWDTAIPTFAQLAYADDYFKNAVSTRFLLGTSRFREIPESDVPEVAFLGRSNVGKSSLLNIVFNRPKHDLAHISKTPGRTQTMNAYGIGSLEDGVRLRPKTQHRHSKIIGRGGLVVVDMPGYGAGSREEWGPEIIKYLTKRKQLRRAFLLVDAGVGFKPQDYSLLQLLRLNHVPHQVIFSKVDKVLLPTTNEGKIWPHSKDQDKRQEDVGLPKLRALYEKARRRVQPAENSSSALGEFIACSTLETRTRKLVGIDGIRFAILQAVGLQPNRGGGKPILEPWTQGSDEDFVINRKEANDSKFAIRRVITEGIDPSAPNIDLEYAVEGHFIRRMRRSGNFYAARSSYRWVGGVMPGDLSLGNPWESPLKAASTSADKFRSDERGNKPREWRENGDQEPEQALTQPHNDHEEGKDVHRSMEPLVMIKRVRNQTKKQMELLQTLNMSSDEVKRNRLKRQIADTQRGKEWVLNQLAQLNVDERHLDDGIKTPPEDSKRKARDGMLQRLAVLYDERASLSRRLDYLGVEERRKTHIRIAEIESRETRLLIRLVRLTGEKWRDLQTNGTALSKPGAKAKCSSRAHSSTSDTPKNH